MNNIEKKESNFTKRWKKNVKNPYWWIIEIIAVILLILFFMYGGLLGL